MFFTVKKNLKIGGKYFRPCICYDLPQFMLLTVRKLEAQGDAEITEEPVFFQNGAKIDPKELKRKEKEAKIAEKLQKRAKKQHKNDENEASEAEKADSEGLEGF
jgi:hypothetical protein